MTHKSLDLAKHYPAMLEILTHDTGMLPDDDKHLLVSHLTEMLQLGKEANHIQQVVTTIHSYTLWKAKATLTIASAIKLLQGPHLSPELDLLDQERRAHFLDTVLMLSDQADQHILSMSKIGGSS